MADVERLGTAGPCGAACPCGCGYVCALDEGHRERAHQQIVTRQSGCTFGNDDPSTVGGWEAQTVHLWRLLPAGKGGPRGGQPMPLEAAG